MKKSLLAGALTVLAVCGAAVTTAGAVPIDVLVSVDGAELAGDAALGAFDITVTFDPAVSVQSWSFGDQLNFGDPLASAQFGPAALVGPLNFFEVSFLNPATELPFQLDAFVLFKIRVDAPGAGLPPLALVVNALGDEIGNPLPFELVTASARAIPEPAVAFLLSAGLLGVMSRRRPGR